MPIIKGLLTDPAFFGPRSVLIQPQHHHRAALRWSCAGKSCLEAHTQVPFRVSLASPPWG